MSHTLTSRLGLLCACAFLIFRLMFAATTHSSVRKLNTANHRCKKRSRKNKKNVEKRKNRGKNKKRLKTLNKKRWP